MDTQHIIKVKPVSEEEAWTLFIERLGHVIAFSPEVEQTAKSITKECDGLPLGIITMAGTMKGVDDIHEGYIVKIPFDVKNIIVTKTLTSRKNTQQIQLN
jgi:hypothetical protein